MVDAASLRIFGPTHLAALGWNNFVGFLTIVDLRTKRIVQQTPLKTPATKPADTVPTVIPRKIGGSSPIKHVVVIVKENRTYDQVLGDPGEGSGDAALAQFGKNVTPNLHALAKRFGDLDNFYDEGTLSADGHNWLTQAEANDYNEKEFGAFYRSYPSQGGDALAYVIFATAFLPFFKPLPHSSHRFPFVFSILWLFGEALLHPLHYVKWTWEPRVFAGFAAGMAFAIGLGSFLKIRRLAAGGSVVAEFLGGRVESCDGLAQLLQERGLGFDLLAVRVRAAELAEENLAIQAELRAYRHDVRDSE